MEEPNLRAIKFGIFARFFVLLSIALVYKILMDHTRPDISGADIAALTTFVLLLSWLLTPRLRVDDGHLDDTGDGFALRLGKAAKRGLRLLKLRL